MAFFSPANRQLGQPRQCGCAAGPEGQSKQDAAIEIKIRWQKTMTQ
jgi:hypothetical protein